MENPRARESWNVKPSGGLFLPNTSGVNGQVLCIKNIPVDETAVQTMLKNGLTRDGYLKPGFKKAAIYMDYYWRKSIAFLISKLNLKFVSVMTGLTFMVNTAQLALSWSGQNKVTRVIVVGYEKTNRVSPSWHPPLKFPMN